MKKRFLFILLIAVICFSSISAIHAMDINNDTLDNNVLVDSQNDDGNVSVEEEKPSTLVAPDIVKYYKNGTNFEATLKDLDGNPISGQDIIFTIKGVNYIRTTNANGVASLPINLLQGNYSITTTYISPDSSYFHKINSTIEVLPNIVGGDLTKYYGDKTSYLVQLLKPDGTPLSYSKLSFTVNGKTYGWTSDSQGKARYNLNFNPGTYTITTRNLADNTYRINIVRILPTISGGNIKKYFNNGTKYTVKLLKADGTPLQYSKLTFTVKGKTYHWTSDSQGIAALPIGLSQGKYTIVTKNLRDGISISNTIEVLPNIVPVSGNDLHSGNLIYSVKILNSKGKPLSKSTVQFIVNGKTYNILSDSNGIARLNLGSFDEGSYSIKTINIADKSYLSSNVMIHGGIISHDLSKSYLDSKKQFDITVFDRNGKPLGNAKVDFTVISDKYGRSATYTRTTDSDGSAQLLINLIPGTYTIKTVVPKIKESCTNIIQISNDLDFSMVLINDKMAEISKEPIAVALFNKLHHEVVDTTINLIVDGKSYSAKTDNKGIASFYPSIKPGVYDATFVSCDGYIFGAYKNTKITILKGETVTIEANTDIVHRGDLYSVIVKDSLGNPLPNCKGYFSVKNVKYNVVTDSNGVASLRINLVTQNIPIQFTINQIGYSPVKQTTDLKVITSDKLAFSSSVVNYANGQKFTVKLTIGGVPFSNQHVNIAVNGKTYNVVTDTNGIASFIITGLNPGKHNVVCSYSGFGKCSKTFTINIVNRMGTNIQYLGNTVLYKEDSKSFSVKLTGSNNLPIVGQTIKFTIKNKDYYQKTNGEGVATLPIGLGSASWTITYSFAGNSNILSTSGSKKISIVSKLYNRNSFYVTEIDTINFANLKSHGVADLFVHAGSILKYSEEEFIKWIQEANSHGIHIHMWVSIFKGTTFYPPILADGTPNYKIMEKAIAESKYYALLPGVSGIHLDFVRFAGDAYKYSNAVSIITNFVRDYSHTAKSLNPNLILSFALAGRADNGIPNFGQDVSAISKYVDVIVQLCYKSSIPGGYPSMTYYTKWCCQHSSVPVWVSVLGYRADSYKVPIPASELYRDSQVVINAGAWGISVYRWGISNLINFKTLF